MTTSWKSREVEKIRNLYGVSPSIRPRELHLGLSENNVDVCSIVSHVCPKVCKCYPDTKMMAELLPHFLGEIVEEDVSIPPGESNFELIGTEDARDFTFQASSGVVHSSASTSQMATPALTTMSFGMLFKTFQSLPSGLLMKIE